MSIVTQNRRYLPHEISTKVHAVETYRKYGDIRYICRKYKVSKASLMRWNKRYDGSADSLAAKSHRPHSPHPRAHTQEELTWIKNLHRRNPNISACEMYGKLRTEHGYSRNPGSLYRVFVRLGYQKNVESTKKKSKHWKHLMCRILKRERSDTKGVFHENEEENFLAVHRFGIDVIYRYVYTSSNTCRSSCQKTADDSRTGFFHCGRHL